MKKLFLFLWMTLVFVSCFAQITFAETSEGYANSIGGILTAPLDDNQHSLMFFVVSNQEKMECIEDKWSEELSLLSTSLAIVIAQNMEASDSPKIEESTKAAVQNAAMTLADQASKIGLEHVIIDVSTDAQRTAVNEATDIDNDLSMPIVIVAIGYPAVDMQSGATFQRNRNPSDSRTSK